MQMLNIVFLLRQKGCILNAMSSCLSVKGQRFGNYISFCRCGKSFSQQARLKAHLMTHTGVKHIKCLLCEKAYSVRKSLRRHLLEKHEISPEHPQYKHCFYAMSAAEAGLHIPEGVPTNITGEPVEGRSY